MIPSLALIPFLAAAATVAGGLVALRFSDRLHLVLGFSAGAVIGVAFFDLLPEALELSSVAYDTHIVTSIVALAFVGYLILDRMILFHAHSHDDSPLSGGLGAGSLAIHSFLDGLAIGIAFQVSAVVGTIVAAGVLAHGFSDGLNTVSIILKHGGSIKSAFRWLIGDAIAPGLGILASLFITFNETQLGILLAMFAGFFLYIGASDLLPESQHRHPTVWTSVMTVLGIVFVYGLVTLLHLPH